MSESLGQPTRLCLDRVTLCAVSSSNICATVKAMEASLSQIDFAEALLLTDQPRIAIGLNETSPIEVINIEPIRSSEAYSRFLLERLPDYISTSHCLIVQWDGHVVDAGRWQDEFLDYDYIGASWPQFDDGHDVGNGGFSLRSRRLMEACQHPDFRVEHPEDVAIGRTNRAMLENLGLRFPPAGLADQFSAERASDPTSTFGYHGVFHMPRVVGVDGFWAIYLELSDRTSVWIDLFIIFRSLMRGPRGLSRSFTLIRDWWSR